ncbi:MAG: alpha/beta hydrolase [Acidobacteria bacterium]|mgnify:CR=1 FL=1|nr:MAG: alpha/beta hydrolase [Acidobacteriota bacterium]REJ99156.1 MAG: alpha/beta hydrolase [Acidobacteriota bacterium]REK16123.1 MAG: alpha/beta hydrolase [Acidobacteriota bacterium]REK43804.1 MAG: alpha/beta hydrolase [Acidobacteriota bacterium]
MKKKHIALGIGGAVGATIAWKLITRPETVRFEDHTEKLHHPDHSNFTEVDGISVHYQEFGDKSDPTLVLIHGFTASTYVWKTVAPALAAQGFHVIAPDLPGFGYSEKPAWYDYSIGSQSRVIQRLMNRLGVGKATLVGSSYGGAVSMWFALDNPERVTKLVLVDAVCNNDPKNHPVLRLAEVPGIGEVITPFLVDSKMFLKFRMQQTIDKTNHDLITADRIESVQRPIRAADGHRSVLLTSRNWDADRLVADAELIEPPTLLVWGENDKVIPIENGEFLYDRILNSRFVVLRDCGHIPMEEKPEIFVKLVTEFMRDPKGRLAESDSEDIRIEQIHKD